MANWLDLMICAAYKWGSLLIYATLAPSEQVFDTISCNVNHIIALPIIGANEESVCCTGVILIQAACAALCSGMVASLTSHPPKEETWRNFSTPPHKPYGGVALHARGIFTRQRSRRRRLGGSGGVPLSLVVVGRALGEGRPGSGARSGALSEGDPRRQGPARYEGGPQDCGAAAGREVTAVKIGE